MDSDFVKYLYVSTYVLEPKKRPRMQIAGIVHFYLNFCFFKFDSTRWALDAVLNGVIIPINGRKNVTEVINRPFFSGVISP